MSQRTYTVILSTADCDTAVNRLDADGFTNYSIPFKNAMPVVLETDPDERDPRGYIVTMPLTQDEVTFYQPYLSGLSSLQVMNHPWQTDRLAHIEELHSIDCFLAKHDPPLRRRWRKLPAIGTAMADGSKDAQATSTSRVLVNQWTELIRLVNMGTSGMRFKTKSSGKYQAGIRISYIPHEDVTFGLQLVLYRDGDPQLVGPELQTSDGYAAPAVSNFPTGNLQKDDLVGLVVRSDVPSTFKIQNGRFRLKRIELT